MTLTRRHRFSVAIAVLSLGCVPLAAQSLTPQLLNEMPAIDRVLRDIQDADAAEMAARQMGALLQLRALIHSWLDLDPRRNRDNLTPQEDRLINDYYAAYWRISQSKEEYQSMKALRGYDISRPYRDELLQRYFSETFRQAYANMRSAYDARVAARRANEQQAFEAANAAAKQGAGGDPGTIAVQRCMAAGRSLTTCLTEVLGGQAAQLFGAPVAAPNAPRLRPGLRYHGAYQGPGNVGLTVTPGTSTDPGSVVLTCGTVAVSTRTYAVQIKDGQTLVSAQIGASPMLFSLRSDGVVVGPGPTDVTGSVVVGYKTEDAAQRKQIQEYEAWQYNPSSLSRDGVGNLYTTSSGPVRVPIYAPRTERCDIGVLRASAPPALPLEGVAAFVDALATRTPSATTAPTGVRIVGVYAAVNGLIVDFRAASARVQCQDVEVAGEYRVAHEGGNIRVTLQLAPQPITLTLQANGTLTGSASVAIAGRIFAGLSANGQPAFSPKTMSCAAATLAPVR